MITSYESFLRQLAKNVIELVKEMASEKFA